jgi:polyisoprenoid-binding protein YceI
MDAPPRTAAHPRAPWGLPLALALLLGLGIGGPRSAVAQSSGPGGWVAAGEVRYEARDALASWSGVAAIRTFELDFDPDDPRSLHLTATVATADFRSGNVLRDRTARRDVFRTELFPTATLAARPALEAAVAALAPGGEATWLLDADLTLHGVTRRYRIEAAATRSDDGAEVGAEASFVVSLEAHGMLRPSLLGLLTDDAVRVRVTATARLDPAPTPTTR